MSLVRLQLTINNLSNLCKMHPMRGKPIDISFWIYELYIWASTKRFYKKTKTINVNITYLISNLNNHIFG